APRGFRPKPRAARPTRAGGRDGSGIASGRAPEDRRRRATRGSVAPPPEPRAGAATVATPRTRRALPSTGTPPAPATSTLPRQPRRRARRRTRRRRRRAARAAECAASAAAASGRTGLPPPRCGVVDRDAAPDRAHHRPAPTARQLAQRVRRSLAPPEER